MTSPLGEHPGGAFESLQAAYNHPPTTTTGLPHYPLGDTEGGVTNVACGFLEMSMSYCLFVPPITRLHENSPVLSKKPIVKYRNQETATRRRKEGKREYV